MIPAPLDRVDAWQLLADLRDGRIISERAAAELYAWVERLEEKLGEAQAGGK